MRLGVFLSNWKLTITNDRVHEIEYKGLLWVVLDSYSIYKYKSNDKPMLWIKYTIDGV